MTDRLKGKLAFCTASGAGIGRATAIAFAREGARVIATDLNEAALAGLKEAGVAECVKLDARDTAAIEAQAKRLGPVDVLFNAAGFVHHGTVLDCSEQDWDFSFDLNVKSMHRTIKAFLPGMLAKGRGSIVNIASTVGASKTAPNRYVYTATKAAVVGLTKAVAIDFIGKGIRCNCICPGTIQTPSLDERIKALGAQVGGEEKAREMFIARQPMGRLGTPEEMAHIAVYPGLRRVGATRPARPSSPTAASRCDGAGPAPIGRPGFAAGGGWRSGIPARSATGGLCEKPPAPGCRAAAPARRLCSHHARHGGLAVGERRPARRRTDPRAARRRPADMEHRRRSRRAGQRASAERCLPPPKSGRASLVATSSGSIPARRSATSSPGTVGTASRSSASRP